MGLVKQIYIYRKHALLCLALLALFAASRLQTSRSISHFENPLAVASEAKVKAQQPESYFNSLSFAEELLPLGDERVEARMNRFLHLHSYKVLRTSKLHQQASRWFPIIEPILAHYGIPEDFKYIPLVESGLAAGVSPKGAAGFWQFMPETARDFGLTVNNSIDERNNIRKSTIAAAKYLRTLHREFNSWTLAAAAYNVGEGRLKRHIYAQKQDNYFKMKLNRETASYVYKLISMKEIIENPTRYGYSSRVSTLLARNQSSGAPDPFNKGGSKVSFATMPFGANY